MNKLADQDIQFPIQAVTPIIINGPLCEKYLPLLHANNKGYANNKGADQPAFAQSDQHLCYSLSEKYSTCSQTYSKQNFLFWLFSVAEQAGLSLACPETHKTGFLTLRPKWNLVTELAGK